MMSTAAFAQTVTMSVADQSGSEPAIYSGSSCTGGPCPASFPSTSAGGTTRQFAATSTSGDVVSMIAYYSYNVDTKPYTCQFAATESMSTLTGSCFTLAVSAVATSGQPPHPYCAVLSKTTTSTPSQPCNLVVQFAIGD